MLKMDNQQNSSEIPVLVVVLKGGLIQHMYSSSDVRVIVLDGDIEGGSEADNNLQAILKTLDGSDFLVADYNSVVNLPGDVQSILTQL